MKKKRSSNITNTRHSSIGNNIFLTANGYEVPIEPISVVDLQLTEARIEKAFRDRGEPIDPPTYIIKTDLGDEEVFEITEKTLKAQHSDGSENEEESKRRLKLFLEHKDAVKRLEEEAATITQEIIMEGIALELPEDDEWTKRLIRRYVEIPKDKHEKWLLWLESEVFRSYSDLLDCIAYIFEISMTGMVAEEDKHKLIDLFRNPAQSGTGQPEEQVEESEGIESTEEISVEA